MAHSDDQGLIIPPRLAPLQVVIVPIYKGEEQKKVIDEKATSLMQELKAAGIRVKYDDSDNARPGWKFAEYELKGVPVRLALGARDLENNVVEVARRDTKEKSSVSMDGLTDHIKGLLADIQQNMFNKAKAYRDTHITKVDSWDEFRKVLEEKGGFISAHWDGTGETEEKIKQETKATIRCIPLEGEEEAGTCVFSGKPSARRVLFAQAY
jgi:prolyl-tRNA synthetase